MYHLTKAIECQGIPYIEYRVEPEIPNKICFDFTPTYPFDEYAYDNPKFIFCEQVILANQWEHCKRYKLNFEDECPIYRVAALELVEISLTGNCLYEAPHWLYGIRAEQGIKELTWVSEDELISLTEIENNEDSF